MAKTTKTEPRHIVELYASNVVRLKAVRIRPDGNVVIVGGRNEQGKSSVLNAIEMAIGGGKSIPEKPIHDGATKAEIILDLGDIKVERTFTLKGTNLKVYEKAGDEWVMVASPQAMLDKLYSRIALDPLEFTRMKEADQAETLRKAVGIDLTAFTAKRNDAYARRTEIGRERDRFDALAKGIACEAKHDDAPKDVAEIESRIKGCNAEFDKRDELKVAYDDEALEVKRLENAREECAKTAAQARDGKAYAEVKIAELQKEIARLDSIIKANESTHESFGAKIAEAQSAAGAALKKLNAFVAPDLATLTEELNKARAFNAEIEKAKTKRKHADDAENAARAFDGLTQDIEDIDAERNRIIAKALKSFKVPGVSFNADGGVMVDGFPLKQASSARQLQISTAIGLAINPNLKVLLIRDGSLLDAERLKAVAEMAEEAGAQIFIERVGKGEECSVIIEDGEVEK